MSCKICLVKWVFRLCCRAVFREDWAAMALAVGAPVSAAVEAVRAWVASEAVRVALAAAKAFSSAVCGTIYHQSPGRLR